MNRFFYEDAEDIDLRELMEELPGGANHGRKRTGSGSWRSLSTEEQRAYESGLRVPEEVPPYIRTPRPEETIRHGLSAYRNLGCRCPRCKAANTSHIRRWRQNRRDVTS